MKRAQKVGLSAMVLFVIAHFLPAYGNGLGYACFGVCWNTLLGRDTKIFSGAWFYYSGFVVANILFVGLVAVLFFRNTSRKFSLIVSIAVFLQVLSWWVLHMVQEPSQISEIQIGYYAWLIAYGLLIAAHFWNRPAESIGSVPFPPQAI